MPGPMPFPDKRTVEKLRASTPQSPAQRVIDAHRNAGDGAAAAALEDVLKQVVPGLRLPSSSLDRTGQTARVQADAATCLAWMSSRNTDIDAAAGVLDEVLQEVEAGRWSAHVAREIARSLVLRLTLTNDDAARQSAITLNDLTATIADQQARVRTARADVAADTDDQRRAALLVDLESQLDVLVDLSARVGALLPRFDDRRTQLALDLHAIDREREMADGLGGTSTVLTAVLKGWRADRW